MLDDGQGHLNIKIETSAKRLTNKQKTQQQRKYAKTCNNLEKLITII